MRYGGDDGISTGVAGEMAAGGGTRYVIRTT